MIFIPNKLKNSILNLNLKEIIKSIAHLKGKKKLLKTKMTLICTLKFNTISGIQTIFFISSHLPIKTKKSKHSNTKKSIIVKKTTTFMPSFFRRKNTKTNLLLNNQNQNNNNNNQNTITVNNNDSDPENLRLGYKLRVEAITQVLDYINKYIKEDQKNNEGTDFNNGNNGYHIIWIGDLNFRMDRENNKTSNQITKYIEEEKDTNKLIKLRDLSQIEKYGPTCKTLVKSKDNNSNNKSIKNNNMCKKQYSSKTLNITNSCYDKHKRIPSYCDRILGWSSGDYKVDSVNVSSLVNTFFATLSDHNPILGELKFDKIY